jgi:hypothetical protein
VAGLLTKIGLATTKKDPAQMGKTPLSFPAAWWELIAAESSGHVPEQLSNSGAASGELEGVREGLSDGTSEGESDRTKEGMSEGA